MPDEDPIRPYGILTSDEPAPALKDQNGGAGADGTRVTGSVPSRNALQRPLREASASTTIAATATPQQQFVGHHITITGQLTAIGTPVAEGLVKLYSDGAGLWYSVGDTTTNARGDFAFKVTQPTAGTRDFEVAFPGSATHEPSVSDELSVTFVTIPTTITATATLRQQFVGHDVTITGQLTANGTPVADAPITLFNAADVIERVPTANTTTDASGFYQFTVADTAPSHHTYVVRATDTSTYTPVQSSEISISFVTIPTTITATAAPRQQFVGHPITITGQLTANGTPVADAPITLYNADDIIERVPTASTTTDASGFYQFTVADTAPSHHTYVVRSLGSATHEPSVSDELSVTFVTIPTTITATATPQQQFVGHHITITGQLTANGVGLVEVPVVLYNTDDPTKKVLIATTTTDAYGYYEFTLTGSVAVTHAYTVCAEGNSTYSRAQSPEILATFAIRGAEAPAARIRTYFNLVWYELLAILLILVGEGLLFAGHRVAGVGVQALNIVAVSIIVVALHGERVQLVQALAVVSVFRVVNLSFALIPTVTVYWLAIVYGVLYVPLIAIIVHEKMSRYDLGIDNVRRSVLLVPLGVLVGTGFALIEYRILANQPLIPNASALELIQLSIVMIFFVALVEALLFFVLLQPQLINRSGAVAGILITSVIFGAMHAGYANVYELLFSIGAGVVLGISFYKTRNLALIVTILAVNNILLFGILPFFGIPFLTS